MDKNTLNQFIKKTLETYDYNQANYISLINCINIKFINTTELSFTIKNENPQLFNYELLGYYDNQEKIWIWSWLISDLTIEQTQLARNLLNYGLKLDSKSNGIIHNIIKPLLVNSTLQILEPVQLDVNISIYFSLLSNHISFIYIKPVLVDDNPLTQKDYYYLIKK